jgi:hypothetical protein
MTVKKAVVAPCLCAGKANSPHVTAPEEEDLQLSCVPLTRPTEMLRVTQEQFYIRALPLAARRVPFWSLLALGPT